MLRKYAYLLLTAIFASVFFTACDDDDNPIGTGNEIKVTKVSYEGVETIWGKAGDEVTIQGSYFGISDGTLTLSGDNIEPEGITPEEWGDVKIEFFLREDLPDGSYTLTIKRADNQDDHSLMIHVGGGPEDIGAITAISMSPTSVFLSWPASSHEGMEGLFKNYMVRYNDGTGEMSVVSSSSQLTINDLAANTAVEFSVTAVYADDSESANPRMKTWAGADRFPTASGTPIMLYSSSSNTEGSGLEVYDSFGSKPAVLKVADGARWNYGLYTKNAGQVNFGSANYLEYNFGGTPTRDGQLMVEPGTNQDIAYFFAESLDDWDMSNAVYNKDLSTFKYLSGGVNLNVLKTSSVLKDKGGVLFIGRVPNGNGQFNYVRMFIKYDVANDKWLFNDGTSGDTKEDHLRVFLSYQKAAGVPYAGE